MKKEFNASLALTCLHTEQAWCHTLEDYEEPNEEPRMEIEVRLTNGLQMSSENAVDYLENRLIEGGLTCQLEKTKGSKANFFEFYQNGSLIAEASLIF